MKGKVKRLIATLAFCCLFISGYSQAAKLFKTYDDYVKDNFEKFDEVSFKKGTVIFKSPSKEVKYNADEIWGFIYDNLVFRTNDSKLYMVNTSKTGKIILYLDGDVQLLVKNGKTVYYVDPAEVYTTYISSGLTGKIFITGFNPMNSKPPKKYKQGYEDFQEKHPEHKKFYDCVGDTRKLQEVMTCLTAYNKAG